MLADVARDRLRDEPADGLATTDALADEGAGDVQLGAGQELEAILAPGVVLRQPGATERVGTGPRCHGRMLTSMYVASVS